MRVTHSVNIYVNKCYLHILHMLQGALCSACRDLIVHLFVYLFIYLYALFIHLSLLIYYIFIYFPILTETFPQMNHTHWRELHRASMV